MFALGGMVAMLVGLGTASSAAAAINATLAPIGCPARSRPCRGCGLDGDTLKYVARSTGMARGSSRRLNRGTGAGDLEQPATATEEHQDTIASLFWRLSRGKQSRGSLIWQCSESQAPRADHHCLRRVTATSSTGSRG